VLASEIDMSCESQMIHYLKMNCPNIWSIFNQRAKRCPPKGFQEFLSGEWAEDGKVWLQSADKRVSQLIQRTSERQVGDSYRRDISGVESENKLAELFCEITLADSLGSISDKAPTLRPKNETGTECDVKVVINGFELFGDSKRLEDKWVGGRRSIAKSPSESKPTDADRPRAMDLHSKLRDTPRQFPNGTLNVIFLFHPSIWNTQMYIKQALFGDKSAFVGALHLYEDGLYSLQDWRNISACAYSKVKDDGSLSIEKIWENPNAFVPIPEIVKKRLEKIG